MIIRITNDKILSKPYTEDGFEDNFQAVSSTTTPPRIQTILLCWKWNMMKIRFSLIIRVVKREIRLPQVTEGTYVTLRSRETFKK